MNNIEDRHLMTDEKLLQLMENTARVRNHSAFDHWEDALWQRYVAVRFDLDTFPVPFDREGLVRKFFPKEIQGRYWEIRSRIYPDLSGHAYEE